LKIISILVTNSLIGCTSLQAIEAPPEKLHEQIRHEDIVKAGDMVRIIAEEQKEHLSVVTAINGDQVRGVDFTVPINSIATVALLIWNSWMWNSWNVRLFN
jgi:hypothetical protein